MFQTKSDIEMSRRSLAIYRMTLSEPYFPEVTCLNITKVISYTF